MTGVALNGPALDQPELRLPGNLNVSFADIDGESLLMSMKDLALSSGSACTSATPEPSHVLRALGLSDEVARGSVRFGLGRFNTEEEIEFAVDRTVATVERLRRMGSVTDQGWLGTGPFFGEETCLSRRQQAENMDLPFRPATGTVPCDGYTGTRSCDGMPPSIPHRPLRPACPPAWLFPPERSTIVILGSTQIPETRRSLGLWQSR